MSFAEKESKPQEDLRASLKVKGFKASDCLVWGWGGAISGEGGVEGPSPARARWVTLGSSQAPSEPRFLPW